MQFMHSILIFKKKIYFTRKKFFHGKNEMAVHFVSFIVFCFLVWKVFTAIVVSFEFVGANFCGMSFFLIARNGDILGIRLNMFLWCINTIFYISFGMSIRG